jgi:hypothetical protein
VEYPGGEGQLNQDMMLAEGTVYSMPDTLTTNAVRPVPTPEQIRYWKIREVNRMFHGDSREISPHSALSVESISVTPPGLVLPSRIVTETSQDWFILILFTTLALFASVRHLFAGYISNLIQSLFNYSTASRMFRERNVSLGQGEIRLEIFSYLVFGLLLYQAASYFNLNIPFSGFLSFLISLGVVLIFFMLKKLIYFAVGFVTEKPAETGEFLYNFSNHIRVMGILSLPIVALIAWSPVLSPYSMFLAGLTIVLILYLILLWRGTRIFLKKQFSIFYLFLYLWTLEILPLLLMLKWITE